MKGFIRPGGWSVGLMVLAFMVLPLHMAWGLTLGAIEVKSHLGEPFDATVAITLGEKETAITIEATKAIPEDYQPLSLEYHEILSTLLLDLQGKGSQRRLSITSKVPVNIPFFNFLLKLSTGQGDHFRNYPIFLEVRPSTLSEYFPPAIQSLSPPAVTATDQDRGEYGPVRPGETLLGIADKFVIPPYSRYQVLAAFYELNKALLVNGNMNGLPVGVILQVPPLSQMGSLSADQAKTLVTAQHQNWTDNRSSKGGTTSTRPKIPADSAKSNKSTKESPQKAQPDSSQASKDVIDMRLTVSPSEKDDGLALTHRVTDTQSTNVANTATAKPKADNKTNPDRPSPAPPEATLAIKTDVTPPPSISEPTPESPLKLKSSEWQAGMIEVDSLKKDVTKLTDQLNQSESSRSNLQLQMTALEARFKKLEQDRSLKGPEIEAPFPWEPLIIGGVIVVLVTGLLVWLSSRGRRKMWSAPPEIPAKPVAMMQESPAIIPQQARSTPNKTTTTVQDDFNAVHSDSVSPFSENPPPTPDPAAPKNHSEREPWETEESDEESSDQIHETAQTPPSPTAPIETVASQAIVGKTMASFNAMKNQPVLSSAADDSGNDDLDAGILDLGGEEDEADNIFSLGAKDNQSFGKAVLGQEEDDSASIFDLGGEETDIPPRTPDQDKSAQKEERSSGLLEIGQEDEGSSGLASELPTGNNSLSSLLNEEESVKITKEALSPDLNLDEKPQNALDPLLVDNSAITGNAVGDRKPQDFETIVFELSSGSAPEEEKPSPAAKPIEVETVAFELSKAKPAIAIKTEKKSVENRVSPLESKEKQKKPIEDDPDDDLLELELITEE